MEITPAEQIVVETPENIRFGYDVADIGSRFLAILIDSIIQGIIYVLLFLGIALLAPSISNVDLPDWAGQGLAITLILVLFLIQFGYFLFLEIFMNGQTPGKRVFHLRVIKDTGYPFSPIDSVIRNLVRIIDFFPFAYGVGVVVMFTNLRAKRLGDYAGGTIVVKMRDQVTLNQLTTQATAAAPAPVNTPDGVRKLDEADISLAESFLLRRTGLTNAAALSLQIAARLAQKMELPEASVPTTPDAASTFISETVKSYRAPRA